METGRLKIGLRSKAWLSQPVASCISASTTGSLLACILYHVICLTVDTHHFRRLSATDLAACNCRIFLLGSIVCISLLNPSTYVNTCSFALRYVLPCRESNHMTSSKVCKKVAENWTESSVALNGEHVTFRACRARDLMCGHTQSSQQNAYHLRTWDHLHCLHTENARFWMSYPRSMSRWNHHPFPMSV